jgi:hypothetical protein
MNTIDLELNRIWAMDAAFDEAAEALRQAIHTGDFTRHDQAMTRFRQLNSTREARAAEKAAGGNHGE